MHSFVVRIALRDRKSTRLNSSHSSISYAVFCLKKKNCQWACPAHTPVQEYIRLIEAGRYGDAYMLNWESNVFPGVLGRTCDRPCDPACRRGRVQQEPLSFPPLRSSD